TRILLADDHLIVRQDLRALLEGEGFEVMAEVGDGQEATKLARQRCPDVAVLDFSMPSLNGLDAAREILKTCPRARAILLTMHTEDHYVLEALRAGVKGYVVKTQAAADLVRAIHEVQRGMVYLSPGVSQTVVQAYLTSPSPWSRYAARVMAIRVLLADDHQIVRQGLKVLLQREGFEVADEAANGQEAVRLARERCPDVAVLDYAMPVLNGVGAAREILQLCPRTKVILLTMYTEDHYAFEALRAGIKGYVVKSEAAEDLARAILEVSRGKTYLSPGISRAALEVYTEKSALPRDTLTPREREVLQLVAEGKTTKEIGQLLGISFKTAESHRLRIMKKLETHNTAGVVRYAIKQGLIQVRGSEEY